MPKRTSALFLMVSLVGCGGSSEPAGSTTGGLCAEETRADQFEVGMEKQSDTLRVRLQQCEVEGVVGPPDRGLNTWTVEIRDRAGAMVHADEVKLRPWMPDHGHGTAPALHYGVGGQGRYELGPFDVRMGGYWEFRLTVTASGAEDLVEFGFCVEG